MSRLSRLAVSKRSVTLLFAAALFVAGISAWGSLKQELLPDIEFPVVTVVTPYPGAGSSDVLEQVTRPIERAIGAIPRLELIQSTSSNSISLVVTQFAFGSNVPETTAAIQDALAKASLPDSATPTVQALNINASPVVVSSIAATSPDGLEQVATIARTEIVPEVAAIEGVARADLTGGLETRLAVTLDPAKLTSSGVSTQQVVAVLGANNLTLPSGQLPADGSRTPVSTIGRLTSAEEVEALVVGYAGTPPAATPVTIGDLGTVELDSIATTGYGRTNGQPALTLTVSKTSNANTVEVADAVQAKLSEIAARHADVMTVSTVQDLSVFIKESRDGLLREGGLGAIFAVIVIFLFLLSLRATIVAAISIPLSILTALVIMQITGVTINIMTLGGLAVAVGRVVDDAIVVLENIYRHRSLGEDRLTAAINGPKEVAGAITASTLTTVAVFLPLGFVGGLVSQFFLPFALTVTFALLASLVCALTVVPVLGYFLIDKVKLQVDETGEPIRSVWVRGYTPVIRFVLRSRWTRLGVVALAPASCSWRRSRWRRCCPPSSSTPAPRRPWSSRSRRRPARARTRSWRRPSRPRRSSWPIRPSSWSRPASPARATRARRRSSPRIQGRATNSATMTVRLKDDADVDATSTRLATSLEPLKSSGYDIAVSSGGGFTSNGLRINVTGPSAVDVAKGTEAVVAGLADQPDLVNLKSDLVKATPEVQVTVDPNKAIAVGMSAAQVSNQVRSALVAQTATTIQSPDGQTIKVIVQVDPADVASVDALKALPVGTVTKVPLATIATVEQVDGPGQHHPDRPAARGHGHGRDHERGHRRRLQVHPDRARRADGQRSHPGRHDRRAGGRQPAAERGVRRPVRLDGRGRPARLRDDGPDLQLAHHPVRHPVHPAARDDRRLPGAVPDRPADRGQRAHRLPDAHRHRGHQRDRHARSRGTPARRGTFDEGRPHRRRADACPADPDDRPGDDPRADPARGRLQPGLDHRRRARHGRHRRPVQRDLPDPARHPGRLLAGRRPQGADRAPARWQGCRGGAGGGATGGGGGLSVADQASRHSSRSARSRSTIDTIATHAGKISASGSKKPTLKSMTSPAAMPRRMSQRGKAPVRRPMVDDTSMNAPAIFTAKT